MMEIDREKIKAVAEKYDLEFVVLFGSQAAGHTHQKSDVDIAYFPPKFFSFDQESKLYLDVVKAVRKNLADFKQFAVYIAKLLK